MGKTSNYTKLQGQHEIYIDILKRIQATKRDQYTGLENVFEQD